MKFILIANPALHHNLGDLAQSPLGRLVDGRDSGCREPAVFCKHFGNALCGKQDKRHSMTVKAGTDEQAVL